MSCKVLEHSTDPRRKPMAPPQSRGLGRVFKVARLEKTVDVDVYVDELVEVGVAWPIEV